MRVKYGHEGKKILKKIRSEQSEENQKIQSHKQTENKIVIGIIAGGIVLIVVGLILII